MSVNSGHSIGLDLAYLAATRRLASGGSGSSASGDDRRFIEEVADSDRDGKESEEAADFDRDEPEVKAEPCTPAHVQTWSPTRTPPPSPTGRKPQGQPVATALAGQPVATAAAPTALAGQPVATAAAAAQALAGQPVATAKAAGSADEQQRRRLGGERGRFR